MGVNAVSRFLPTAAFGSMCLHVLSPLLLLLLLPPPNQRGIRPHPFPPLSRFIRQRERRGKSCGWRGGEALQSARRSAAAVQRAQIAPLLTQISPVPRHTGLTLTPAQQDVGRYAAGCPRQTRLTITHTHAFGHRVCPFH